MLKEYDTFVDDPTTLAEGEMAIAIRELTPENRRKKYLTRYVRAAISKKPPVDSETGILYLRYQRGRLYREPWSIRIIEELGEFMPKKAKVQT